MDTNKQLPLFSTPEANIIDNAIQRAVKQLTNMGCTLKVVRADGTVVADTLPKTQEKKKRAWKGIEKACGYKAKLENIQPGEVVTIAVPPGLGVKNLQASMTSFMAGRFGNGSYISERNADGTAVTILRVE